MGKRKRVDTEQKKVEDYESAVREWQQRSSAISAFLHDFKVSRSDLEPGHYHNLYLTEGSAFVAVEKLTKQVLKYHNEMDDLSKFHKTSTNLKEELKESAPTVTVGNVAVTLPEFQTLALQRDSAAFIYEFFKLRKEVRTYMETRGQISTALDGVMQQLYNALDLDLKVSVTHPQKAQSNRMLTQEHERQVNEVENLGSSTALGANTETNSDSAAAHFVV